MRRGILVLALVLIALGVVGLVALNIWQSALLYSNTAPLSGAYGMMGGPNGMMGNGMMGNGYGFTHSVNATPVPATQAIDREIKIAASNSRFDPARVVVKKGETVRFVIANQDAVAHNFVSQDGRIAYTFLPANATLSVVWVASEKGTFTALCTYHAGMQMQIIVE